MCKLSKIIKMLASYPLLIRKNKASEYLPNLMGLSQEEKISLIIRIMNDMSETQSIPILLSISEVWIHFDFNDWETIFKELHELGFFVLIVLFHKYLEIEIMSFLLHSHYITAEIKKKTIQVFVSTAYYFVKTTEDYEDYLEGESALITQKELMQIKLSLLKKNNKLQTAPVTKKELSEYVKSNIPLFKDYGYL